MTSTRMRTAFLLLVGCGLLVLRSAAAEQPKAGPPAAGPNALSKDDEAAVRQVFADYEAAWNRHDMTALGNLFRQDAQCINIVGMHWRGRDEIVAAHAAFHATMFKNHRIRTDAAEVRSPGRDLAVAVVTTTNDAFTTPDGHAMPKAQNRQTYVLSKGADGWKVDHFHNVRVDADAAANDPAKRPGK